MSISNRMIPSLVGLLDNCSRRSSSPLQISSEATARGFSSCRWRGWGHDLARNFRVWRPSVRRLRGRRRGGRHGRSQFVELGAHGLRMRAVRMRGQESAPSLQSTSSVRRCDSPSPRRHSLRLSDRLRRTSACGFAGQRPANHDADVIEPSKLRYLFEARPRVQIRRWNRQRQKKHVFPKIRHALPR